MTKKNKSALRAETLQNHLRGESEKKHWSLGIVWSPINTLSDPYASKIELMTRGRYPKWAKAVRDDICVPEAIHKIM